MSWRRKNRKQNAVPVMVERFQKHEQGFEDGPRLPYEEANWAKLSPRFREAHNKLRQARGLSTLPPPAVDLYVAPKAPLIRQIDYDGKEFVSATREFLGGTIMGGGVEGFTINGKKVNL